MIFVKFLRSVNLRRTSGQERSGKWSGTPDNLTDGLTAFISPLFVKVWRFKTGKVKRWNSNGTWCARNSADLLIQPSIQPSSNLHHQPRRCTGHRGSIGDWHRLSGNTCQRIPQLSILSMLSASFIIFQHRQHILYVMEHIWNTSVLCSHRVHLPLENIGCCTRPEDCWRSWSSWATDSHR